MFALTLAFAVISPQAATDPCEAATTDATLLACRRKEAGREEEKVATLGRRLTARAKDRPALVRAIKTAELAWTRYRDAQCAVETFDSAGSTGAMVYLLSCRAELDRAHGALLQHQMDNP